MDVTMFSQRLLYPWNFDIWRIKESGSIHKTIKRLIFEGGLRLVSPCGKENSNSSHPPSLAAASVWDDCKLNRILFS